MAVSFDIQRAGLLKRIAAFILDFIVITVLATFFIFLISKITNYDYYNTMLISSYDMYEAQYGVIFSITEEEYSSYSEDEKAQYDNAYSALTSDSDAMAVYSRVVNLTFLSLSLGIFLAYLLSEFIVPLIFGNGITIGKKIFGLSLMRTGGWKVNAISLFVRTILGKYTIETMVPILLLIMILFNMVGIVGTAVILFLFILNIVLVICRRERRALHDLLADTIVVDYSSQRIFDSEKEMIEAKKQWARERAEDSSYY